MNAPQQATHEAQKALQEVVNNIPTEIILSTGRKVRIGWLYADTQDMIDEIIVHHDSIAKKNRKRRVVCCERKYIHSSILCENGCCHTTQ